MGDLVGQVVEGTLYVVPRRELERVRWLEVGAENRARVFADLCRLNTLTMIAEAGSGHLGSSFSSLDIVSWLHLSELRPGDVYFSSKGHDAPGLYSVLIGLGRIPFDNLHRLRRLGGLPGHPDIETPGIVANTGSLGMGISKAKGRILANRLSGQHGRVFVMTGDGELQEGQIWESLIGAANRRMGELTVIVDHNKLQSDRLIAKTSPLGTLSAKFSSFGCAVRRIDGHDLPAFRAALEELDTIRDRPKVVIADTIKGRGVSFMEHTAMDSQWYAFHSGAPSASDYVRAAREIIDRVGQQTQELGIAAVEIETVTRTAGQRTSTTRSEGPLAPTHATGLIAAYARALEARVQSDPRVIVLDADLLVDTGQLAARTAAPERFVECGIAEMDMVSQAGALALGGYLPVVHSFAAFLSARPNEQIYNNASERSKVIYVGTLAGLLPAGPGHSHQGVRDISALGGVPGLVLVEPSCEREVGLALDWCIDACHTSAYLRLVSALTFVPFTLPEDYRLELGRGVRLTEGTDALVITAGPVLTSEAYRAAERLKRESGFGLGVVNLPWLNNVDGEWLAKQLEGVPWLFTLDNHYVRGGQGDFVCAALAEAGLAGRVRVKKLGLVDLPACGKNEEVLRHHQLDADSVTDAILARVRAS